MSNARSLFEPSGNKVQTFIGSNPYWNFEDTYILGNDLVEKYVKSFYDCGKECQDYPGNECHAFTYKNKEPVKGMCSLKKAPSEKDYTVQKDRLNRKTPIFLETNRQRSLSLGDSLRTVISYLPREFIRAQLRIRSKNGKRTTQYYWMLVGKTAREWKVRMHNRKSPMRRTQLQPHVHDGKGQKRRF